MIDLNVLDPHFYAGDPYPTYARLREEDPCCWDPTNEAWVVSRYADVVHVSKNPKIFSSASGVMVDIDNDIGMITMDDPRHAQVRRLINRGFTPRMVRLLEDRIRDLANGCIDPIAHLRGCDFTQAIAVPLPLLVIAELIGIHPEDRDRFAHWSDTMILAAGQTANTEILDKAAGAYVEYNEYLQSILEERRREPREDLASILVRAYGDGTLAGDENITRDELQMFMTLLLVAGNETTRNAISGGMVAFGKFPEEWQKLRENPDLIDSAIEEILRFVTPVAAFRRTATQDTELHGRAIKKGQKVVMLYQAANRDPAVFDDPESFRIDRSPNDHLAFGIGVHFCLGANLARLEIRVVLQELLRRLPDIHVEPGQEPVRALSPLVAAIDHLPVVYTPEAAAA